MDTLDGTEWDVLIAGTGIQQSLLALALSRSDKKVLHIDKNDYYGGAEAAFSLQEAQNWVQNLQDGASNTSIFASASIMQSASEDESTSKLSFSRAYSLALAPQLIYTDSKLLPSLVSSKTYKQLEFVAMGSWFVYNKEQSQASEDTKARGTLLKIPTTREDLVFSDKSIDIRSKRAVMRVLRFLMDYEAHEDLWHPYAAKPFSVLLTEQFKLPARLHGLFFALTLSLESPQNSTTTFALPRIARHLRSTGQLGTGFSSVIPKWGGLSEISQVACRAGAVGGAVYALCNGMQTPVEIGTEDTDGKTHFDVTLSNNEKVKASWIVGTGDDISSLGSQGDDSGGQTIKRSISVVSSALPSLFPALAEGGPPPAGAVAVFPAESLSDISLPVYLIIHSSDTGECPQGQCVVYATTRGSTESLDQALSLLVDLVDEDPHPSVLWRLKYEQQVQKSRDPGPDSAKNSVWTIVFPTPSTDLAFDETILDTVKDAWQKVMGQDAKDFLVFEDRNPVDEEDDEE